MQLVYFVIPIIGGYYVMERMNESAKPTREILLDRKPNVSTQTQNRMLDDILKGIKAEADAKNEKKQP